MLLKRVKVQLQMASSKGSVEMANYNATYECIII